MLNLPIMSWRTVGFIMVIQSCVTQIAVGFIGFTKDLN